MNWDGDAWHRKRADTQRLNRTHESIYIDRGKTATAHSEKQQEVELSKWQQNNGESTKTIIKLKGPCHRL